VKGTTGIVLTLICFFVNGVGINSIFTVTSAYAVDAYQSRSAEAIAAINGFRACMVALASTGIIPAEKYIGPMFTNAIAGGLAWIGFGLLWIIIRYGARMRESVDVGLSTRSNN